MKRLGELISVLLHKEVRGNLLTPITGIAYHSNRVLPGNIFVCLPGTRTHGQEYVQKAVSGGAAAVVADREIDMPGIPFALVPDSWMALALLSTAFYDFPTAKLVLTGVTGTNGKTTTSHLIDIMLQAKGKETGLIGTVRYHVRGKDFPVLATTPEASDLQSFFAKMVQEGVSHATMEVSSHALSLRRTVGCDFDTVVLTNIAEDHLDFHRSFSRYLAAKSRLFSWQGSYPRKGSRWRRAVINGDDRYHSHVLESAPLESVLYGLTDHCHIRAKEVKVRENGTSFTISSPAGEVPVVLPLTGLFSVYNSLAAASVGMLEGIALKDIKDVLESFSGVPGRMENIDEGQDFVVLVDYAHTPDGLENVLSALQSVAKGRIITVFGCGGERDQTKRPLMGEVAASYSDYCILTNDNPRREDPDKIINDVLAGLVSGNNGCEYEVLADRSDAIGRALKKARKGDIVLIAGKGHETQQVFADNTVSFDDREVAREHLRRMLEYNGD